MHLPKNISFRIFIICCLSISFCIDAQNWTTLKVGSYNVRYDNQGDREAGNAWENRLPVITSILRWENPDIFGAQEVLHEQLLDLEKQLLNYDSYGVGRDDGKTEGEYAPIFYKKDRFTLLSKGEFWLSETPEKPSRGWDAALPRICTWVHLQDKTSHEKFWIYNLHMDHVGVKARAESAKLVERKIQEKNPQETVFLMGDFNVDQHNEIYEILNESNVLKDSYTIAKDRMAWNGTFNAFDTHLWTDSRIDHIFVSRNVVVDNYAILTETYRSENKDAKAEHKGDFPKEVTLKKYNVRLPSDHFPVFVRVQIKGGNITTQQ